MKIPLNYNLTLLVIYKMISYKTIMQKYAFNAGVITNKRGRLGGWLRGAYNLGFFRPVFVTNRSDPSGYQVNHEHICKTALSRQVC